jgi:hypothetical protein
MFERFCRPEASHLWKRTTCRISQVPERWPSSAGGGFIGHHIVRRLKREGFWVRGTDLNFPCFSETDAVDFVIGDLRDQTL